MRAGRFDRRLELRHRVLPASDGNGSRLPTYTAYATVWAQKTEIAGREVFAAQQAQAEATVRFTIRYRSDVLSTDRVVCEGRDYQITQPPSEIGRREGLMIVAQAVVQ